MGGVSFYAFRQCALSSSWAGCPSARNRNDNCYPAGAQFRLFTEADNLTAEEVEITALEAIALLVFLSIGLVVFMWRRRTAPPMEAIGRDELSRLRALASQDPLTGLANRRIFTSTLQDAVDHGRTLGLLLLDVNDFKQLNDTFGHARGDRFLQIIAKRLRSAARPGDLVARLGGDEFAVIAWDVDREICRELGWRIIDALTSKVEIEGRCHTVGVSIGAALLPADDTNPKNLMQKADCAMYEAKATRRSNVVLYDANKLKVRHLASA